MVFESVQSYVNLVSGLSRATRAGARKGAQEFWAQSGLDGAADDAGEKVTKLTEELRNAGRANRELLEKLIGDEVTRAVRQLGFVRSEDLDEVREEIAELRHQLDRREQGSAGAAAAATKATKRATTTASASTGPSTTTSPGKVAAATRAAARTAAAAADPSGTAETTDEPPSPQRRARKRAASTSRTPGAPAAPDGVPGAAPEGATGAATEVPAVPGGADAGA